MIEMILKTVKSIDKKQDQIIKFVQLVQRKKIDEEILTQKIDSLPLRIQSINGLLSENIETIGQLVTYSQHDILSIPNIGMQTLNDIKTVLFSEGLSLRMDLT